MPPLAIGNQSVKLIPTSLGSFHSGERMAANDPNLSSFIWSVADLLRGDYKQSDYGKVILPFTVLRRLDCVLEATKPAVLKEFEKRQAAGINPEPFLLSSRGNCSNLKLCDSRPPAIRKSSLPIPPI